MRILPRRYRQLEQLGVETIAATCGVAAMSLPHAVGSTSCFRTAAIAGIGGHWRDFYQTNVVGTRHVVEGCRQQGVGRLIYTSSPSVTFDAADQNGVDEQTPPMPAVSRPLSAQQGDRGAGSARSQRQRPAFLRPAAPYLGSARSASCSRSSPEPEPGGCAPRRRGKSLIDMTYVENAAGLRICWPPMRSSARRRRATLFPQPRARGLGQLLAVDR